MLKKVLLSLILFVLCVGNIQANSAQTYWEGSNHTGVIQSGEKSPIVVVSEDLIFTIEEFPQTYYENVEDALSYNGKVEAKYEFYNPTDMDIKVRLLFPLGNMQSYAFVYDHENEKEYRNYDVDKYTILLNDQKVDKTIRYTYKYAFDVFDLEEDLLKLSDTYKEDELFNIDTSVKKYTFKIENVQEDCVEYALGQYVDYDVLNKEAFSYYVTGENVNVNVKETQLVIGSGLLQEDTFEIYYIGEELEKPEFKLYANADYKTEIKGDVTCIKEEELSFKEYVLQKKNVDNISDIDWYNAYIDSLEIYNKICMESILEYDDALLQWYDYTIEIKAYETITNTVSAPLYPGMNTGYEPPIYEYTYLLTPASTFEEFHDLTITIQTPYNMSDCTLEGFEKTDTGYELKLDTLPEEDLKFTLCESETSKKVMSSSNINIGLNYILPAIIAFVGIGALAFLSLSVNDKKKK